MSNLNRYARYRGRPHVRPHGCWRIVAEALAGEHGATLPAEWGADLEEDDLAARAVLLQERLSAHGCRVDHPQPGDVAAMWRLGRPIHVALVVAPGWLLQSTTRAGQSHFVRVADVPYGRITYHRPA